MRPLSKEKTQIVESLLKSGLSQRKIVQQSGVSKGSVFRIARSINSIPTSLQGRPKKLSQRDENYLFRSIISEKFETAKELSKDFKNPPVSAKTIARALKKQNLVSKTKVKKPLLLKRHRKARLNFARAHKDWTVEDWRRVIFSDESKINRFWSDGRKWCWKLKSSNIQDREVAGTVKFGGGGVMVWGCITAHGVGHLTRILEGLDQALYQEILSDEFLGTCEFYGLDSKKIIFQQDNDPKHTAKKTKEWFQNNEITVLPWPAQSPDLNPIEHIWVLLKRKLNLYENSPTGMLELWERIEEQWNKISKQECLNLIDSMPRRVQAVLRNRGGYTKY